jgi:glycosyltransferase involved in cell wall biosynthesis
VTDTDEGDAAEMLVSVIICTYDPAMYEHFLEAVESVQEQSYEPLEIVIVVDGTESIFKRVRQHFDSQDNILVQCNDENLGVSASRTRGAELASGEVVAFIDDDAIAESHWIATLADSYNKNDVLAAGGQMTGKWIDGRPRHLPEEFNWLVGVSFPDFAKPGEEVRNTFESNISFRRDVFLKLGGYNPMFGPNAESYSHSEGAELGHRLQRRYDRGVVYVPEAVVAHKVFTWRTELPWLLKRAFWQGYSKRRMEQMILSDVSAEERRFLRQLLTKSVPQRIAQLVREPDLPGLSQLTSLGVLTLSVGLGYFYGVLRW